MTPTRFLGMLMTICLIYPLLVSAQSGETFTARLAWVPITVQQRADVAGKGSVTASLSGRTLTINGSFEGLPAPATAARLHRGVARGARGPALSDLTITTKATSGTISGSVALSADQVDYLKQGRLYVQVYSEKGADTDGSTLWGWLGGKQ
jgi:hypothetical protein